MLTFASIADISIYYTMIAEMSEVTYIWWSQFRGKQYIYMLMENSIFFY
jgi:hypothetical protein